MHDSRRTRLVLGALLVAALALITFDSRGGTAGPVRDLRALGGTVFGSAESMVSAVVRPVTGFFGNVASASSRQGQITALQRQVTRLRAELSMARLSRSQEAQLQRLLQLSGRGGYRIVAANVVAAGPPYENTVTIDAGRMDGIAPDETVLNGDGLVGTVTAVSTRTSTVLLTTDASSTVGVRVAGTGEIGAVTGAGRTQPGPVLLQLQVFDANAVLHPGQQLVTFGSVHGRPYVPGVPVGVITRVQANASALTKLAFVRPYADDSTLSVVGVVIVPPRKNPRDSVLPPSPSPSTSLAPRPVHRHRGASPSPTPAASSSAGG
ncbi:MAG TPA: rod shape-determining protein MreC [Actinobacteria bacterium]|nr:rod shape-determining protein MreC [Actinomycetota bacterium]